MCPIYSHKISHLLFSKIVTKFWKINFIGAHLKKIRIFDFTTINLAGITKTQFKYFYPFPCNSKHFYCIGTINEQKTKFQADFQN